MRPFALADRLRVEERAAPVQPPAGDPLTRKGRRYARTSGERKGSSRESALYSFCSVPRAVNPFLSVPPDRAGLSELLRRDRQGAVLQVAQRVGTHVDLAAQHGELRLVVLEEVVDEVLVAPRVLLPGVPLPEPRQNGRP